MRGLEALAKHTGDALGTGHHAVCERPLAHVGLCHGGVVIGVAVLNKATGLDWLCGGLHIDAGNARGNGGICPLGLVGGGDVLEGALEDVEASGGVFA